MFFLKIFWPSFIWGHLDLSESLVYFYSHLKKNYFKDKPPQPFDTAKLKHLSVWGYVMAPSYMALFYSWLDTRFVATTPR